jgi:hypothetical protein
MKTIDRVIFTAVMTLSVIFFALLVLGTVYPNTTTDALMFGTAGLIILLTIVTLVRWNRLRPPAAPT